VQATETVRGGVHVRLWNATGTTLLSERTTTSAGWYVFNGLATATYQVEVESVYSGPIPINNTANPFGDIDTADYDFVTNAWFVVQ